jgi:hypothetical protein
MKTYKNTDTFKIQITEIENDDNPNAYEITFTADCTPAFIRSTEYFTSNGASENDDFDDLNEYDDNETYITYNFNIASRHDSRIYHEISGDNYSGDSYDDAQQFIYSFGNEIYEFIKTTAKFFNIPIYEI